MNNAIKDIFTLNSVLIKVFLIKLFQLWAKVRF